MSRHNSKLGFSVYGQTIEYIFAIFWITALFYFLFGYTLQAKFSLIDDHHILRLSALEQVDIFSLQNYIDDMVQAGRFRPGYVFLYLTETVIYGTNEKTWHLSRMLLGILTTFLFYFASRKIGSDRLSSVFLVLLITVTASQNSIWYRLGTGETWGMFLTGLTIVSIVKAADQNKLNLWDGIAIFFLLIVGSTKESFILIIPSLLLLRVTLHWWRYQSTWFDTLRCLKTLLIGGVAAFLLQSLFILIVLTYRPEQYGAQTAGISLSSFSPIVWFYNISNISNLLYLISLVLLFFLILTSLWLKDSKRLSLLLVICMMLIGWFVPQLILYSNSINGHYLFPALAGLAAFNAFGLAVLWHHRYRLMWVVCILLLTLPVVNGVITTTRSATVYTADTLALHKMITFLAESIEDKQTIIIVADPVRHFEGAISLRTHLRFAGLNSPIYLLPVYGDNRQPQHSLALELIDDYFRGETNLDALVRDDIGAIVGLTPPNSLTNIPSWYIPDEWKETKFISPYYTFSLIQLEYKRVGDFAYTALLPAS